MEFNPDGEQLLVSAGNVILVSPEFMGFFSIVVLRSKIKNYQPLDFPQKRFDLI